MGFFTYPFEIDREGGILNYLLDYSIEGYSDPETGEYFGDTYWQVTITVEGGSSGGLSGYASEQYSETIELGLGEAGVVRVIHIDFYAHNTFSAVSVSDRWTVRMSPGAYDPRTIVANNSDDKDFLIGGFGDDLLSGLGGNDILDAGDGNDQLYGGAGNDVLNGGADTGDEVWFGDRMWGGLGDDYYFVDSVGDRVFENAGEGVDHVYTSLKDYRIPFAVENVTLTGNIDNSQAQGSVSDNVITGDAANNRLVGNGGNDTLRGMGGDDKLFGGPGDDILEGGTGADQLYGSYDDDILNGGAGGDHMVGGAGNDTYHVDTTADSILELADEGYDTVIVAATLAAHTLTFNTEALISLSTENFLGEGNALRNSLTGGSGNDKLLGWGDNDRLRGGLGDDTLEGGEGADSMDGGKGNDKASYAQSSAGVDVRLLRAVQTGGEAQGDQLWSIENLTGSSQGDTLHGNDLANEIYGGGGADILRGLNGNDRINGGAGGDDLDGGDGVDALSYAGSNAGVTVNLGASTATGGHATGDSVANFESVIGSSFADTLIGDGGANVLLGSSGNDTISGGSGDDTIGGGTGADWMDGQGGANTVSYATSLSRVSVDLEQMKAWDGDASGDRLFNFRNAEGGYGNDSLFGNGNRNTLIGGEGNDKLYGRDGSDVLRGGAGGDLIDGGAGNDTVSYAGSKTGIVILLGTTPYAYGGDAQGDTFISIENVRGSEGNDYIGGDDGDNRIDGRAGFDYLSGNGGNDTLTGGANGDQFHFGWGYAQDTVTDFEFAGDNDVLFLEMGPPYDTFEDVMAVASATGVGGVDTQFDFGGGDVLTLRNVLMSDLSASDFIFWLE